jgi:hypothetical protein
MLDFLKRLFSAHKPAEKTPEAPYKVETTKVIETTPLIISSRPPETAIVEEKPAPVVEEVPVQIAKPKAKRAPVKKAKPAAKPAAKPVTVNPKEPKLKRTK